MTHKEQLIEEIRGLLEQIEEADADKVTHEVVADAQPHISCLKTTFWAVQEDI